MPIHDIKSMLTSELSLNHFNYDLEIIATSDANDYGIGAVICQKSKIIK